MLALPMVTAPAALSRSTTVASYGATKFSSIFEAQEVTVPRVQKMSLCASGIPVISVAVPAFSRSSAARAAASAPSSSREMKALRSACLRARSRKNRVSSTLE